MPKQFSDTSPIAIVFSLVFLRQVLVPKMKSVIVLAFLCIAGVQCSKEKRDVSELLYKKQNLLSRPLFDSNPGYDYPRPGISQGPIYRDPEPVYGQPGFAQRPIYREEPTWVQTRPVAPSVIVRPNFRPSTGIESLNQQSAKIFWPFNGGSQFPGWGNGGTNTIGYPGNSFPGTLPSLQTKFSFLNGLLNPFGNPNGYPNGYPNNRYPGYYYQRMVYPAPRPVITVSNPVAVPLPAKYPATVYPASDNGVNIIGDGVIVEAEQPSSGYNYPRPVEQLLPLDLPNSVQFRAEPKDDVDS